MRTIITLLAIGVGFSGVILAQEKSIDPLLRLSVTPPKTVTNYVDAPESTPTRRILAEDIEQDSIMVHQFYQFSTNAFAVRWTYTEAGAKKMLTFQREHTGHKIIIQIGSFEFRPTITSRDTKPAGSTGEGYLKHRGDSFIGASEDDAKKIVDGLKKK